MARLPRVSQDTKIKPDKSRVEFMAERIGLEPMDRKTRSQISNLLHYHSANAPCRGYYIETQKQMQAGKCFYDK